MVFEKLKTLIAEHIEVDESDISESSDFYADIGCDELDFIEIQLAVEDEFDISIPDADAEKITTVGELADYIKANI
jgi:acyl carrier protein